MMPSKLNGRPRSSPMRCERNRRSPACSRAPQFRFRATLPRSGPMPVRDRKSTRLNSSHQIISYAVFCLKKKKKNNDTYYPTEQNATTESESPILPNNLPAQVTIVSVPLYEL